MKKHFITSILLLIVFFVQLDSISLADTSHIPLRIVALTDEGLQFFEWTQENELQAISEPFKNFTVKTYGGSAEWMVLSSMSFAVSPDAQKIAFTARREDEAALFIYDIADRTLTQHETSSHWLILEWSPDSEAILLGVAYPYWDDLPLPDEYVYELATDSLFQITFTEDREKMLAWTADSSSIVYFGWCNPDKRTSDLCIVSRDGNNRFPITDFPSQHPPINAYHLEWDAISERWYYIVGYSNPFTFLYSTDVNGNNQLEIDPMNYLLTTEGLTIEDFQYGGIRGIHSRPDGVYLSAEFSYAIVDETIDLVYIQPDWRILRLSRSGQLETIYQQTIINSHDINFGELTGSIISPNGEKMVFLANNDRAFIIDIANNQNIAAIPNLTEPGQNAVCDVRWWDDDTVVYNVGGFSGTCIYVNNHQPLEAWMMNVNTGEVTSLTADLGVPAWVLSIPEY